jgi:hypothetical protein
MLFVAKLQGIYNRNLLYPCNLLNLRLNPFLVFGFSLSSYRAASNDGFCSSQSSLTVETVAARYRRLCLSAFLCVPVRPFARDLRAFWFIIKQHRRKTFLTILVLTFAFLRVPLREALIARAQGRSECERPNPKSPSTGHHGSQTSNIFTKRFSVFKSFPLRTSARGKFK